MPYAMPRFKLGPAVWKTSDLTLLLALQIHMLLLLKNNACGLEMMLSCLFLVQSLTTNIYIPTTVHLVQAGDLCTLSNLILKTTLEGTYYYSSSSQERRGRSSTVRDPAGDRAKQALVSLSVCPALMQINAMNDECNYVLLPSQGNLN